MYDKETSATKRSPNKNEKEDSSIEDINKKDKGRFVDDIGSFVDKFLDSFEGGSKISASVSGTLGLIAFVLGAYALGEKVNDIVDMQSQYGRYFVDYILIKESGTRYSKDVFLTSRIIGAMAYELMGSAVFGLKYVISNTYDKISQKYRNIKR